MHNFPLITAVVPVLLWFGLFLYLLRVEKKLKAVSMQIKESAQTPSALSTGTVKPVNREVEPK